jgi:hypothetical protein
LFSAFQALADEPTEYFVHPDGGTLDQCDGTSSTPYSDSISNKECAVNHIFELLDPEYYTLNIKGGDVITIMNNTDGSIAEYEMGRHGKYLAEHCSSAYNYECHTPSIPSGSEENPTIIRGALTNGKCEIKPMLFGTGRAARIFTINDSQHIELSCLTITDKSSCIGVNHPNKDLICNAGHPYNKPFADKGLYIIDSKNIILRDLDIQGLGTGIHAGRLENISLFNVNIYANYLAGWDGDIGKGVSGNEGTMLFKDSSIIFNGCALIYDPSSDKHNKPHACARQDIGGYGDGLGTEKTGGDWIFDNTTVMYNSSDGIDLLYHHDGGDITVMNSRIEGNAGNQVKTSGNAVINNNIIISNCGWNSRQEDYLGGEGETCRAQGNALSLFVSGSDDTITLINNTVISEGDCIILTEAEAGAVPDNQKISIVNNILYGAKDFHPIPVENSCLHYTEFVFPTKQIHNNIIHMVKGYGSPCTDFNSEDIPDGDNANSGSCSIGNGVFDDSDHSITTNPRFEKLDLGIRHTNYDVASLKSEANKPYPINKNGPSYKKAYTAAVDGINMPDTDVLGHERGNEPDIGAVQSLIKSTPPATIEVTKIK